MHHLSNIQGYSVPCLGHSMRIHICNKVQQQIDLLVKQERNESRASLTAYASVNMGRKKRNNVSACVWTEPMACIFCFKNKLIDKNRLIHLLSSQLVVVIFLNAAYRDLVKE